VLTREFGAHVFEIAALSRVVSILYNYRTASLLPHKTVERPALTGTNQNHRDEPQAPVMSGSSAHLLNWHILGARKQVLCVGYLVPKGFVSRITLSSHFCQ
jgi:hypothetical protein